MSNLLNETLLTVPEAGRRLGKHKNTIQAWMRRGLLEWVSLPSGQHTSVEAIERMTVQLTALQQSEWRRGDSLPSAPANQRTSRRAHEEAVKTLKRMGIA